MVLQQVSFVERSSLCREDVPISEGPLSEVPLYLIDNDECCVSVIMYVCVLCVDPQVLQAV